MPGDGPDRLGLTDAARLVGLTPSTIKTYISKGLFPAPDGHRKPRYCETCEHLSPRQPWWWTSSVEAWHEERRKRGQRGPDKTKRGPKDVGATVDAVTGTC
jgi:predicted DNA-binding transcriptional regulator AlpA